MSDVDEDIRDFLSRGPFAVVGASLDRHKYGNKVLRAYLDHGIEVSVVHPREAEIEGVRCYPSLAALPDVPRCLSVVTPPAVSERVVDEAGRLGVQWVWLQPGAESPDAVDAAEAHGMRVLHGGPCVLVALGSHD